MHRNERWRGFFIMIIGAALLCIFIGLANVTRAAAQDIDLFAAEIIFRQKPVIGIGAGLAPDYEGSANFRVYALPQARINWSSGSYINLFGPVIRANMIPSQVFGFGPVLRYRPERDSVGDEKVRLLDKVDGALEAGVFGMYTMGRFFVYAAAIGDTDDAHEGFTADVSAGYRMRIEQQVRMVFLVIGTWADDNYMDTYFSVDAGNAEKSGLPEFKAASGIKDAGAVFSLKYNIDWHWGITGIWKYTRLLGDAADSPLVDLRGDRNQFINGLIINYNF